MKNNLKAERLNKGITQVQLAELVSVSRQTIISIESNRYNPSVLLSLKIALVLKKRVEQLFELEPND
jgi:putative transcriptional regulator